ncbi:ATP-binding cassette domain-containing protein [Paracrocinitomix mangrovi]|uniref:ABC transporter ATP-binding protein n=1 Tax=Paracrocinitomix mangrovi TaxID=2862509 RepID=UPI001C8E2CE7|nr:ABC transporter transmembrane domain-containing protein [Paracrocinitomix mangrovi]UKN01763.1 ATP-binding cassette domain-containing protein [Paracrocinitomix mangrovi]
MFGPRNKREKVQLNEDSYKKARRIFKYMKPYRFIYLIGWSFLLVSSLVSMMFPALMGQLLGTSKDSTPMINIEGIDMTDINTILVVMLIVFGTQAFFSFFRIIIFNYVTEKTLRDVKRVSFNKMISYPLDFFNRNKVGELTSRIATDINLIQETLNTTIAEFFRQFVSIGVSLAFILYVSWELSLYMLAVVPVLAIIAIVFGRYIRKLSKTAQDESAKSNSILEEVLTGIVNVKAFTNEKYESQRYGSKIDAIMGFNIKRGMMRGLFVSFIIFGMFGGISFIIWKAKGMEEIGAISPEEFTAFILYTIFLGASFGSIPDLYAKIQKAIGSTEHLMDLLEEEAESTNGEQLVDFKGKVEFKNVGFAYPQRKEIQVLDGISFTCEAGQTVALVGSSGAGKSTISSLLLNFYDINTGNIYFDDKDVTTISKQSLREQIAVVPQEVILFGGTVKENILYGNVDATDEEVIEAAKKANAYDFIMSFPDKFDTKVGDRGIQLSGGQKQRIAIARAVLKNPKILILDEATSALDSESEKLVQDALDNLMVGRTSFVIAHRLSTIKNADKILVIENGKIAEQGKHEELIANENGVYYKLNNIQLQ